MELLTFEQRVFIKKEYLLLSKECQEYYKSNELEKLQRARDRIAVFIATIEGLFSLDFYRELHPSLI